MVPYQMTDLEVRHPETCRAERAQRIHVVETSGPVYRGGAAGREVLRRLPAGWLWALPQNPRRGDRAPCRREGLDGPCRAGRPRGPAPDQGPPLRDSRVHVGFMDFKLS